MNMQKKSQKLRRKNPTDLPGLKNQILFYANKRPVCHAPVFDILQYITYIEVIDVAGYGAIYLVRLKNHPQVANGLYALKVIFKEISQYCLQNLVKYSTYGIIPKIYLITPCYILMDYIHSMTFTKFKHEYNRGKIPEKIYQNIVKKREDIIDKFRTLFPNDERLDIRKTQNMLVTYDFNNVYLIDPCY